MSARYLQQHPSPPALYRRCIFQRDLFLTSVYVKTGVSVSLALSITFFLSLPLFFSLFTHPHPRHLVLSFWFPEADCSSLNNSSWLSAVLSSVLHHSITPLHKDMRMGWDVHAHIHTRAPMPINPRLTLHTVRTAHLFVHTWVHQPAKLLSQVHWDS